MGQSAVKPKMGSSDGLSGRVYENMESLGEELAAQGAAAILVKDSIEEFRMEVREIRDILSESLKAQREIFKIIVDQQKKLDQIVASIQKQSEPLVKTGVVGNKAVTRNHPQVPESSKSRADLHGRVDNRICYGCGRSGHIRRNCPWPK